MDGIGRNLLQLREVAIPEPAHGEILVRVSAVALNHRDKMVTENGRGLQLTYPFTPGSDLAGTVVALGDGVQRFAVGDRVISNFVPEWLDGVRPGDARTLPYRTLGGHHPGVLAEYVAFPEDWFVRAPWSLGDAEAATLPVRGSLRGSRWSSVVGCAQERRSWSKAPEASRCSRSPSPRSTAPR